MIKCDKGRIEIKGTPMVLVGELGTKLVGSKAWVDLH